MYNIVNYVCWIVKVRFLFNFVPCYLLYLRECSLMGSDVLVLIVIKDLSFINAVYELSLCGNLSKYLIDFFFLLRFGLTQFLYKHAPF
jgi:hypothetical protein